MCITRIIACNLEMFDNRFLYILHFKIDHFLDIQFHTPVYIYYTCILSGDNEKINNHSSDIDRVSISQSVNELIPQWIITRIERHYNDSLYCRQRRAAM